LDANKRFRRGEIEPKYERKIDDEEPDRVVGPDGCFEEIPDLSLDGRDRSEEDWWTSDGRRVERRDRKGNVRNPCSFMMQVCDPIC
jgi:hypothetical protein